MFMANFKVAIKRYTIISNNETLKDYYLGLYMSIYHINEVINFSALNQQQHILRLR